MGTDIHIYVEEYKNGSWAEIEPPIEADWGRMWSDWRNNDPTPDPEQRNYELFARLANVRNGYGFAGIPIFDPVVPLFAERGWPNDTSMEKHTYDNITDEESGRWLGDHSFTYLTMEEALEADWDISTKQVGVVNVENFLKWQDTGEPDVSSGDVSGPGIVIHSDPDVYDAMIKNNEIRYDDYQRSLDLCRIWWTSKRIGNSGFVRWVREVLPTLTSVEPKNVRILIGFDS